MRRPDSVASWLRNRQRMQAVHMVHLRTNVQYNVDDARAVEDYVQ
jgi:hypothetical protein